MSALIGLGGSKAPKPIIYSGLNISSSKRDLPIALFAGQRAMSTNAVWYNDFKKHKINAKGKSGVAKGGSQYDYTAATIVALGEGVIDSIARIWDAGSTTTVTTLSHLNQTFYSGTVSQAPEPWVVTNYPSQARSYAYTSYLFCPKMDLGEAAEIPDNRYECVRAAMYPYSHLTPGWIDPTTHIQYDRVDILLSDFIPDWLTNSQYGMGFLVSDIGNFTQYGTYLRAQGLFHSPELNTQEKGTQVLDRYAYQSNSWIYWSGTQLQAVPLGDSPITGNGVTYTPDVDVAYTLSAANGDFLDPGLQISRQDPADCYNRTILNITDATLGYVSNPVEYRDDTLVDLFGLRDNTAVDGNDICDPIVGNIVVQLIGKRAANIRRTYTWKSSYRLVRCLPGTIVTVTDPNIGIINNAVRVTKVEEDSSGVLSFTGEEFPGKIGSYAPSPTAETIPTTFPSLNIDPGDVNTPCIVEPNSSFTGGVSRLLLSASGGANWGGAQVMISFDGLAYSHIGDITSAAQQGVLTATLADHSGLDTTNTLSVDCTESESTPTPVTNADAVALRTLSMVCAQPTLSGSVYIMPVSGELLAFGDVTATGTYSADLTYLERGQYGSSHSAHSIGDQFTLIDVSGVTGATLSYDLPPQYIGSTVYVKFLSYNSFGNMLQDASTVSEYSYTPTGLGYGTGTGGLPATPTGLAAASGSGQNLVSWAANAVVDNVTSYKLYAASGVGSPFSSATLIWQGVSTNYAHTGLISGSEFTYFVVAENAIGDSGHTAGVSATASAPPASVPSGGTIGQALTKNSSTDYDTGWTGPYVHLAGDTMGGALGFTDGSAAAPSAFWNTNYGFIYDSSHSGVGFVNNGTQIGYFSVNGLRMSVPATANFGIGCYGESTTTISASRYSNDTGSAAFTTVKGRGTIASTLRPALNDVLGVFRFDGINADGTSTVTIGAQISATLIETGTVGSTKMGSALTLQACPIGSATLTTAGSVRADYQALLGPLTIGAIAAPTTSALLDLSSTTGALLIPRMTTTQRNALTAANAMLIYDTTVAAFFHYTNGAWVQLSLLHSPYSKQVPTTGFSITIAAGVNYLILDPAGTLATGTVTMPAAPIDGQEVTISSSQIITALTISANTGQSIIGVVTTLGANGFAKYKYVLANTTWYRVG